jgi:hypothetical protein
MEEEKKTNEEKNSKDKLGVLKRLKTKSIKRAREKATPIILQIKNARFFPNAPLRLADSTLPPSKGKIGKKLIIAKEKLASATISVKA